MILSYKNKFVFVHINKCGGTSINMAFLPYLGPDDLVIGGTKDSMRLNKQYKTNHGFGKHGTAARIRQYIGAERWSVFFTFSFVRNPYDRTVSNYFYLKKSMRNKPHHFIHQYHTFDDYVQSQDFTLDPQSKFITDASGNLMVDYLGRVESLQSDFSYICERIGLPSTQLERHNSTGQRNYRDYYQSGETRAIVTKRFSRDLDLLDYEF